jgi:hypothetical protein
MTDEPPRYLDDDSEHRRGRILAVAAVILLVVGALVWQLGIPLWIVVGFIVAVFLGILVST